MRNWNKTKTLKRFQSEELSHSTFSMVLHEHATPEAIRNLEKVTIGGNLSHKPFSMVPHEHATPEARRNLEKVQREEKPCKPFQG